MTHVNSKSSKPFVTSPFVQRTTGTGVVVERFFNLEKADYLQILGWDDDRRILFRWWCQPSTKLFVRISSGLANRHPIGTEICHERLPLRSRGSNRLDCFKLNFHLMKKRKRPCQRHFDNHPKLWGITILDSKPRHAYVTQIGLDELEVTIGNNIFSKHFTKGTNGSRLKIELAVLWLPLLSVLIGCEVPNASKQPSLRHQWFCGAKCTHSRNRSIIAIWVNSINLAK